jgi:hypothetical protein
VISGAIIFRFSDGAWEYSVSEKVPAVGDTLHRNGETWIVVHVAESAEHNRIVSMALVPNVEP